MKTDKDKRIEIIGMYQRGYKVMEILKDFGIEKSVVSKAIKRFNELGTSVDRKGRGRKRRKKRKKRKEKESENEGGRHSRRPFS